MTRHVCAVSSYLANWPTGFIEPCLPTAARVPPSGPRLGLHEIKLDGYRLMARLEGPQGAIVLPWRLVQALSPNPRGAGPFRNDRWRGRRALPEHRALVSDANAQAVAYTYFRKDESSRGTRPAGSR